MAEPLEQDIQKKQDDLTKKMESNRDQTAKQISSPRSIFTLPPGGSHEGAPSQTDQSYGESKKKLAPNNSYGSSWDDSGGSTASSTEHAMTGENVPGLMTGLNDHKFTNDIFSNDRKAPLYAKKKPGGGGGGDWRKSPQDVSASEQALPGKGVGKISPIKQTGIRSIDVSPAMRGKYGEKIFTNLDSGDVLGEMKGDPFRGGKVLPGTGMTDEQISKGTKFAGTLPEGDGGRILPLTGNKDIDKFNKNQMSAIGRNPMDISNPKNLTEGNVRGGELGWAGFGGNEQEQASQQKIADDRRNENMKILSQYLNPRSMAQINQELDNAVKKSEIGYKDSQTARNNEWIRADREREEFARSNPEAETLRALLAEDNKAILAAGADVEARRIAEERFAVHDRQFQEMMNKSRHRQNGSDQTMPAQQYGDAPKGTRPPGDDITVRYVPRGKDKNGKEQYEAVWGQPDPDNKGGFRQVIVKPHQQGLQTQPMGESSPSASGKISPTASPDKGTNLTDASKTLQLENRTAGIPGDKSAYPQEKTLSERVQKFSKLGFSINEAREMAELEIDEERNSKSGSANQDSEDREKTLPQTRPQ